MKKIGKQLVDKITTQRLVIRSLENTDAHFILELLNEPDFLRFIGDREVRNIQEAINYITSGPQESYQQYGLGLLAVSLHTGELIGLCGLLQRETLKFPDLGYAFLSRFYRQGFAFESCNAVLMHYKNQQTILAMTDPENVPSQQLLLKLGFTFTEHIPEKANEKASDVFTFSR